MESSEIKIPNWIIDLSMFLCTVYISYKTKGFLNSVKTLYSLIKIKICKYMYNHCGWFHRYVMNKAKKQGPIMEIFIEMLLSDNCDYEKILEKIDKIPVVNTTNTENKDSE